MDSMLPPESWEHRPLPIRILSYAPLGSSAWLLNLRWFAVVGQLITVLASGLIAEVELPYIPLLACVLVTAVTNVAYAFWLRLDAAKTSQRLNSGNAQSTLPESEVQSSQSEIPDRPPVSPSGRRRPQSKPLHSTEFPWAQHSIALTLMLLDLITLTVMLYFSGGTGNPFSFFYFVNLAVGGVMIRPKAAWSLTAVAVTGFSFLLFNAMPVERLGAIASDQLDLRVTGLMLAFTTCSSVVTYFVTRTAAQLKNREMQLRRTQAAQAVSQRLESLTSLAAGAAHELATPLSTIDVIVRELSRHLEGVDKPHSVNTDLQLIDGQLEMCKQILQRLRTAAGDSMAQRWDHTTVGELIDTTLEGIRDPHRVEVKDGSEALESQSLWIPQEAVAQAIRNLVHNGLDASSNQGKVQVEAKIEEEKVRIIVLDSGEGMSEEIIGRASDPFFTTKEPGRGIGLGLFLARNVISQLGGELVFDSKLGSGTAAVVSIPLAEPQAAGEP